MIDLTPLVQGAVVVAAIVVPPLALLLWRRGLILAEKKFHFQLDAKDEATVEMAIGAGAGMIRADLASAQISPVQVSLGSPSIDQAVSAAMNIAASAGSASGITRDEIATRIVGAVGHALGDDPTVPSAPVASMAPAPPQGAGT